VDIAAWLRELGLERYEEAFRHNDIDAEILLNLNADDLRDMGVTSVGHRRRLLDAIASLRMPEPGSSAVSFPPAMPIAPTPGGHVRQAGGNSTAV
jgi:SAM domain (Sterile alpha motif)